MSLNPDPFNDPFFKQHDQLFKDAQKTVKRGFFAAIVLWLVGALFSVSALIAVIWFVIYLLHHYHVFN